MSGIIPETLLRPEVLALSSYHVANADGLIKLDAMENPYAWPDVMVGPWLARMREAEINRYPDPEGFDLKSAIRASEAVPVEVDLLLGNGSDELIQIVLMAVAKPGAVVLAPAPTFVMYRQIAQSLGIECHGVPLREKDFSLDLDAMLEAVRRLRPAVVFIAYPNNPTGNLFDRQAIEAIVDEAPGLVVLDEAYAPYARDSFMAWVSSRKNLLVMRTLSKLGLAGIRVGYLAGQPRWIEQFDKLRLPYNINVLTQVTAEFALRQRWFLDEQVNRILADRAALHEQLSQVTGVRAFPTQANFILFRVEGMDADQVFDGLKAKGVLIKNLNGAGGPLRQCLRVTVGTEYENGRFVATLNEVLNSGPPPCWP